jgi:hypothetical protein
MGGSRRADRETRPRWRASPRRGAGRRAASRRETWPRVRPSRSCSGDSRGRSCFGRSSPAILRVGERRRVPSPPASTRAHCPTFPTGSPTRPLPRPVEQAQCQRCGRLVGEPLAVCGAIPGRTGTRRPHTRKRASNCPCRPEPGLPRMGWIGPDDRPCAPSNGGVRNRTPAACEIARPEWLALRRGMPGNRPGRDSRLPPRGPPGRRAADPGIQATGEPRGRLRRHRTLVALQKLAEAETGQDGQDGHSARRWSIR